MSRSVKPPQSIVLKSGGNALECSFDTEKGIITCHYSAEYLRVFTPSAEVRGHGENDNYDYPAGKRHVAIKDIQRSGHYAIKVVFDDGHDSGIYTWSFLWGLHQQFDCNWQRYLSQLQQRRVSRDADEQVVRIM